MPHLRLWLVVSTLFAGALAACSAGDPSEPGPKPDSTDPGGGSATAHAAGPTYHKDVEPILQAHCQKCHLEGGLAPFALMTYEDAKAMSPAIKDRTTARTMPPWGAQDTAECKPRLPWNHDERLTDVEIKTLADWDAAGAPEGDPTDAPPASTPPSIELANPTLTLTPKTPFVASGDRDEFRCFVLDHPLSQGAYITGVHVVPGNRKVVHHAVVFTDPDGTAAAKAGPDGSFDCSSAAMMAAGNGGNGPSNMSSNQSITLDVWTPGGMPIDLPSNIAMPLVAGSKLIMQIHYSPGGKTADPDVTKVQLRVGTTKPEYFLFTTSIGNFSAPFGTGDGLLPGDDDPNGTPTFVIPANVRSHVERMRYTVPDRDPTQQIWVYGVLAHEHLAGIDVKVDLDKHGDSQCLLQDRWDFHWQRMYTYASPVENLPTVDPGDVINLRCTYDNSMQNPRLGAEYTARGLTPIDLHLGEQTTDEMCLVIPQLLVKNP